MSTVATIPQPDCVGAGCEPGVQRCSQPAIDCDSQPCSDFAMKAGITTKKPYEGDPVLAAWQNMVTELQTLSHLVESGAYKSERRPQIIARIDTLLEALYGPVGDPS